MSCNNDCSAKATEVPVVTESCTQLIMLNFEAARFLPRDALAAL